MSLDATLSWFSSATAAVSQHAQDINMPQTARQPAFGFATLPLVKQMFVAQAESVFPALGTSDILQELARARDNNAIKGFKRLPYIFMRHFAMHGSIALHGYVHGCLDAEQEATITGQEPIYPEFPDLLPATIQSIRGTVRDFTVHYVVKPPLEQLALKTLPPATSALLLTPPRPGLKFLSMLIAHRNFAVRFCHYTRDAFIGNTLVYVSDFLVHLVQLGLRIFYWGEKGPKGAWKTFTRDAAVYGIRCVVMLGAGSVGAALGTLLKPGFGTSAGLAIGEVGGGILLIPIITPYLIEPMV